MKFKFLGIQWDFTIVFLMIHGMLSMGSVGVLMLAPLMFATAKDHEINGIIILVVGCIIYFFLSIASMHGLQNLVLKKLDGEKKENQNGL